MQRDNGGPEFRSAAIANAIEPAAWAGREAYPTVQRDSGARNSGNETDARCAAIANAIEPAAWELLARRGPGRPGGLPYCAAGQRGPEFRERDGRPLRGYCERHRTRGQGTSGEARPGQAGRPTLLCSVTTGPGIPGTRRTPAARRLRTPSNPRPGNFWRGAGREAYPTVQRDNGARNSGNETDARCAAIANAIEPAAWAGQEAYPTVQRDNVAQNSGNETDAASASWITDSPSARRAAIANAIATR